MHGFCISAFVSAGVRNSVAYLYLFTFAEVMYYFWSCKDQRAGRLDARSGGKEMKEEARREANPNHGMAWKRDTRGERTKGAERRWNWDCLKGQKQVSGELSTFGWSFVSLLSLSICDLRSHLI